jgi:hypothetical protein
MANSRYLSAFILLLTMASHGWAFDGNEHTQVSNDGLLLAIQYLENAPEDKKVPEDVLRVLKEFHEGLLVSQADDQNDARTITYGDLVRLVDYRLDPFDEIRVWGDFSRLPKSAKDVKLDYLDQLDSDTFSQLFAAHLNIDHFQDRLMFSYWWWHRAAVHEAVIEHNLWGALFLNSFGDHFLEDYFAPGHVITSRQGMHDLASLAVHDRYNKLGADLRIKDAVDLIEIMDRIENGAPGKSRNDFEELRKTVESGYPVIQIYGDGDLDRSPRQRTLMTLLCARSILDIVDSYQSGNKDDNSFEKFYWKSRTGQRVGESWRFRIRQPETEIMVCCKYELTNEIANVFGLTFGLNASYQTVLNTSDPGGRFSVEVENLIFGIPPPGNYFRDYKTGRAISPLPQLGLAAGYSGVLNDRYSGHGPFARLIAPIRKIDSQLSVLGGYRWYSGSGFREGGAFYGARFEMGFGLAFLHLGLSREHFIIEGPSLEHTTVLTSGISFVWPASRMKLPKRRKQRKGTPERESSGYAPFHSPSNNTSLENDGVSWTPLGGRRPLPALARTVISLCHRVEGCSRTWCPPACSSGGS